MRLLLIVDDYLPYSIKVAAKMMHELAIQFNKNGHDVTVLTPCPNIDINLKIDNIDDINILYFKSGKIKNTPKIKRAINETLLSYNAWKITKKYFKTKSFDGIVYFSPSIFFGRLVSKLKNLWKCKSYLILRDVFPQWAIDNGLIKKDSFIHYYFNHFER